MGKNQPDALPPSPVRGGIFVETTGPNQPKPHEGRHHRTMPLLRSLGNSWWRRSYKDAAPTALTAAKPSQPVVRRKIQRLGTTTRTSAMSGKLSIVRTDPFPFHVPRSMCVFLHPKTIPLLHQTIPLLLQPCLICSLIGG